MRSPSRTQRWGEEELVGKILCFKCFFLKDLYCKMIRDHGDPGVKVGILGNKSDLQGEERRVSIARVCQWGVLNLMLNPITG